MTTTADWVDDNPSADTVFSSLGNETRLQILRTLGEADGPLSFTELRDRIGIHQGGEFNYHLDKVVGHLVKKTDEGYVLQGAGRQVVQAVFAGVITGDPVTGPISTSVKCPYCGSGLVVDVHQEHLSVFCTGCDGRRPNESGPETANLGSLGIMWLPAAGINGRTPKEILETASVWSNLECVAVANQICPRCSAPVDPSIRLCEDHDASDGLCAECNLSAPMTIHNHCTNCIYGIAMGAQRYALGHPQVREFLHRQGIDPITSTMPLYREFVVDEVLSNEPLEVRFSYTVNDVRLTLTIEDKSGIKDIEERAVTKPA